MADFGGSSSTCLAKHGAKTGLLQFKLRAAVGVESIVCVAEHITIRTDFSYNWTWSEQRLHTYECPIDRRYFSPTTYQRGESNLPSTRPSQFYLPRSRQPLSSLPFRQ